MIKPSFTTPPPLFLIGLDAALWLAVMATILAVRP